MARSSAVLESQGRNPHGTRPSHAVHARRGAPVAHLAGLAIAGCLVPGPLEEEEVPPNYPPVFAPEKVTPPFEQEIAYDPAVTTEPIQFTVPDITDVDIGDRVYWRWFVNYDARFLPFIFANGPDLGGTPVDGKTRISLTIAPCEDLASFSGRTLHRIELVAADRPFLTDDETTVARNQQLPPEAGHFRVIWFVSVDLAACSVVP
jgi:hypothetical protein